MGMPEFPDPAYLTYKNIKEEGDLVYIFYELRNTDKEYYNKEQLAKLSQGTLKNYYEILSKTLTDLFSLRQRIRECILKGETK